MLEVMNAISNGIRGFFGTILLILNISVAGFFMFTIIKAKAAGERGTNTLTRFVRDNVANSRFKTVSAFGTLATVLTFIPGMIIKKPYVCIPTLICVILSFVFQFKSNQNKQRVKDARVVTKTTGKVAAYTGAGAAAIGATVATGGMAAPAAIAIGATAAAAGAARVIDKSVSKMTDVDAPDVQPEDFKEFNEVASKISKINIKDPTAFIAAATRAGIETEGKDLAVIAENVVKYAPSAMISQLPDNLSIEDKAMHIMGGVVE